ncbi:hypothetical protein [Acidithiobacillus sp.]|uniref:hypothetical protein n=1 Tax=Acidithiobacillus sp. TaxID=1872118 RepID=UPI0025BBC85B|nr:hypothetical protein [Acidithiobacillus sp.]
MSRREYYGFFLVSGLGVLCYAPGVLAAESTTDPTPVGPVSADAPISSTAIERAADVPTPSAVSPFANDPLRTLADSLSSSPSLGDATRRVLFAEAKRGDYLPAISWALAQGYWGLAQVLIQNNPQPTPDWAKLSLALHRHDGQEMAKLLQHPERLPVRDRLQAQMDLGQYAQGRKDALAAMEINPYDWRLRREYLQAVRKSASYADLSGSWQSFNGLSQIGPHLRGRLALGNAWGIQLDADALRQSASSSAQLLSVPGWSQRQAIGLYWQHPDWDIQGLIGSYQGVRNNLTLNLQGRWQWSATRSLTGTLAYHDRSLQSPALAVAGMSNRIEWQLTQQLGSWMAGVGAGWRQYQGQDGVDLGSDLFGEASLSWRHGLGPWELQLGPFVDYHDLHRNSQIEGVVAQTLAPSARNIDSVLPGSYGDVGVRLQWGQWERAIDSNWTPYLAVSVYDNTRYGIQYQLDTGVSTPVFGPDRLRIGFSQGQGGNGLAINQQIFKMGYRFYF